MFCCGCGKQIRVGARFYASCGQSDADLSSSSPNFAGVKQYKGYHGILLLTDRAVIIKRGVRGFLLGGGMHRGDKTIPYSSIVAVRFKKAGLTAGYVQLSLLSGPEAKHGLLESTTDANTINFHRGKNDLFTEAKVTIEQRIGALRLHP